MCCLLAGCGLKPLYATQNGVGAASELSGVSIPEPTSRLEQLVRNELLGQMASPGTDGDGVYRLELKQRTATSAVVAAKTGLNQRESLEVSLTYRLTETSTGKLLQEGRSFVIIPYDRVSSEFSNLQAVENAERRASVQLADDIRTRLAAYFATR